MKQHDFSVQQVRTCLQGMLLLIGLWVCSAEQAAAQKRYVDYYDNGHLYEEGMMDTVNDCKVGEWKRYYETGELREVEHYQHGQLEGEMKSYFEDGLLSFHGSYAAGKQHGQQLIYFGKVNAKGKQYLYKRETYQHGLREGMQYEYDGKGRICYKARYEAGQCVADTTFEVDGIYTTALRRLAPTDDRSEGRWVCDEHFYPYPASSSARSIAKGKRKATKRQGLSTAKSKPAPQQAASRPKRMKVNPDGSVTME